MCVFEQHGPFVGDCVSVCLISCLCILQRVYLHVRNRLAFGLVCFRYDSFIIDALVSVENSVLTLFQNCISGNW